MQYQRVLLINPSFPKEGGERLRPSAGLGYLAEAIKSKGIEYDVIDLNLGYRFKHLAKKIETFQPDLIGITLLSLGYKTAYKMLNKMKAIYPEIPIVAGGPHVSLLKEKVIEECEAIDYGVVYEGEKTLIEMCLGQKEIPEIKGLMYRAKNNIVYNGPRNNDYSLDELPFPLYEKFELHKYVHEGVIISSRGCPYKCIFCPNQLITPAFRMRSPQNVVDEIEYWYGKGYRQFNFDDDNFNQSRKRVHEICNLIEQRNLEGLMLRCSNGLRADRLNREVLLHLWKVGFRYLGIGADGGNNKVLKNLQKGEQIEHIENAVKLATDIGFGVKLFFVVGTPGETWEDVMDSARLAQKYPIQRVHFYNLIPYPGTKLYQWAEENNAFIIQPEEYLNNISDLIYIPLFETPELSREQRIEALHYLKKVSKQISKNAVKRLFENYKGLNLVLAHIFTTDLVQRWVFQNVLFRKMVEMVRYQKLMR